MVSCKHCSTQNSLDSVFCKRCGTTLSEESLSEAKTKLDALIEEGNSLFNQGRTEEAMAVADACVTSNPTSVAALSLKVLCHERKGQIAEALECAERIVEVNPDSELDKIKRNALRTRLQAEVRPLEAPDRRVAIMGAIASVVVVGCLGVVIAKATAQSNNDGLTAMRNGPSYAGANYDPITGAPLNPSVTTTSGGGNSTPTSGTAQNGGTGTAANPNGALSSSNPQSGNTLAGNGQPSNVQNAGGAGGGNVNDGSLTRAPQFPDDVPPVGRSTTRPNRNNSAVTGFEPPLPDGGSVLPRAEDGAVSPVRINPSNLGVQPETPIATPRTPKASNTDQAGDPSPITDGGSATPAPKPNQDGDIQIAVSRRGPGNGGAPTGGAPVGGGSDPGGPNGLANIQRIASEQFQIGNYSGAARSYEQALSAGGDSIIVNMRLGQAYQRLGRNSEAADAFRRCINACDAAIASGRGNRNRHESTKSTAEQALKVLSGG